jgi:hypothetical protein
MYIVLRSRKRDEETSEHLPRLRLELFPVLGPRYPARAPIQAILGAKKNKHAPLIFLSRDPLNFPHYASPEWQTTQRTSNPFLG